MNLPSIFSLKYQNGSTCRLQASFFYVRIATTPIAREVLGLYPSNWYAATEMAPATGVSGFKTIK
jgi:hypothetical protein